MLSHRVLYPEILSDTVLVRIVRIKGPSYVSDFENSMSLGRP